MAVKNVLFSPTPIVSAGSLGATLTSPITTVPYLDNIMIQIVATGTPTGTFSVQTSLDYNPANASYTPTWTSLALSGTPTLSGSGDTILVTLNQLPSPYIRVVYNYTSGTGTANIWISGKAI